MNDIELLIERILRGVAVGEVSREDACFLIINSHFKKRPVPIRQFIIDPQYLNCPQAWPEIVKELENCFSPKNNKKFSDYLEAVFNAGIGAGKSFFVSFVFCYVVYWLSCLKDPQGFYGLAPRSTICLVNVSTTATQAKRVVFGKIQARIDGSPYFQKYFKPDQNIRSELRFPNDIVIFPGSSSETAPIGYDVLLANIDEASFFISTDSHDVASSVFDTLDRRIRSRFEDRGMIITTSSPRYVDDFTEKKFDESRNDPTIFGIKKAVWETKPRDIEMIARGECFELTPEGGKIPVKIPNCYEKAFKKNPKKAWRDFGAIASLALEAYFTDDEIATLKKILESNNVVPRSELLPVSGAEYFCHIDLGLKRDACGFAIGHPKNGVMIIDLILRIVCKNRALELDEIGEQYDLILGEQEVQIGGLLPHPHGVLGIIYELSARGFYFAKVTMDGFQSAHSLQQLNDNNFQAELLSVDKNMEAYDTLKSLINMNQFICPNHPVVLAEAKRLELIDGKKVDHPKNASKDLTDAIAGVCKSSHIVQAEEIEEEEIIIDESVRIDISEEL